jgi:hypothetical protein
VARSLSGIRDEVLFYLIAEHSDSLALEDFEKVQENGIVPPKNGGALNFCIINGNLQKYFTVNLRLYGTSKILDGVYSLNKSGDSILVKLECLGEQRDIPSAEMVEEGHESSIKTGFMHTQLNFYTKIPADKFLAIFWKMATAKEPMITTRNKI